MASQITTSRTLDITTIDDQMNETTYKLNGRAIDGLTLAQVRAVYAPMISAGYLYSSRGYVVTNVVKAATRIVTTETEELS